VDFALVHGEVDALEDFAAGDLGVEVFDFEEWHRLGFLMFLLEPEIEEDCRHNADAKNIKQRCRAWVDQVPED
jgi:hypothetical protein